MVRFLGESGMVTSQLYADLRTSSCNGEMEEAITKVIVIGNCDNDIRKQCKDEEICICCVI